MSKAQGGSTLIKGLVALAILQFAVLTTVRGEPGQVPIDGTDLSSVGIQSATGEEGTVASFGEATLLLVFHSDCSYCRVVAPEWAAWLKSSRPDVRIVAASREPYADAQAYADEHGWGVDVVSIPSENLGTLSHEVTRRTPWVFALSRDGQVVTSAHGGELATVAAALSEHMRAADLDPDDD